MTPDEIKKVLEAHAEWLKDPSKGARADLRGADLGWADLSGAYLGGADLSGADLSGADLSRTNLSRTTLSGAIGYVSDKKEVDSNILADW